jgi:hypothetical protein
LRLEKVKAGRKGNLNVATEVIKNYHELQIILSKLLVPNIYYAFFIQILQVAPSLHMVEVRKAKGDTLEFQKVTTMHAKIMPMKETRVFHVLKKLLKFIILYFFFQCLFLFGKIFSTFPLNNMYCIA